MKKLKNMIAITSVMAMLAANNGHSQEFYNEQMDMGMEMEEGGNDESGFAYYEGSDITQSAILPIGIVIAAAAIFASTHRDHGHHGGGHGRSSHSH